MTDRPTVRTQAELEQTWRDLMSPLGFSRESLWFLLLDESGTALPQLTEIEDAGTPPTAEEAMSMASFLCELHPGPTRVAFLRTRPGRGGPGARDRAWAAVLYDACRAVGLPCEVVHLATDADVHPLPWDALPSAVPA